MMSKNSFWVSLKENNKRRVWVWILASLFWFFFNAVGMAFWMSRKKNHIIIDKLTGGLAKARLVEAAGNWISVNEVVGFFISLLAIICAIQGFSYLYSRKKVDLYHSVPVKESRRFAVIYINGILIYLIPYTVSLLLAILVAGINGAMDGSVLRAALVAFGSNLALYMGTYGLAILAVMLTGNLITTLFAVMIFLLYEWVIRGLLVFYQSCFFDYFSFWSIKTTPFLSPMGQYMKIDAMGKGDTLIAVGINILMAVVFTAGAYICYRIRPAEAAGKTMAFSRIKGTVKFLLTVPMALGVVYIVKDMMGDGKNAAAPVIFTMIAAVILGNCMIEVIYERDIKAAWRKKYQILISGACVAAIYCIFCFDVFGFDAWVPKQEQLKEAVVVIGQDCNRGCVNTNLEYIDYIEYGLSRPGITDTEAICELSERKSQQDQEENVIWLTVAYRMKNGRTIWREFGVSGEETELLNRIIGSDEYKAATYQLADEEIYESIKQHKIKEITYNTGFRVENLAEGDFDALRDAYLKDLKKTNYSTYREEFPRGEIDIEVITGTSGYRAYFGYTVYPSYENTIALLKEKGVYTEKYLNAEEIFSITVVNYHSELEQQVYEEALAASGNTAESELDISYEDMSVSKTFYGEDEIQELAKAIYPIYLNDYWKEDGKIDNDYYVLVQYKENAVNTANSRGTNEAMLITEYIPAWLETETAYK